MAVKYLHSIDVDGDITVSGTVTASDFIGPLNGAVQFTAKNRSGGTITKGQAVYISGISGNNTEVGLADADNASMMPAFGLAGSTASDNNDLEIVTFGSLKGLQTNYTGWALGDTLYISTTAGTLTNVPPTGESSLIQNIGKIQRVHAGAGIIKVGGAGRTNATPNLNEGRLFVGNASNQSVADDTAYIDIANSRVGIGATIPSEKLDVVGNIAVSGTVDGIDLSARDAILTSTTVTADAALTGNETVNAPSTLTLSIVDDTINVTFNQSTTGTIDNYLVFSSVDGGDYGLISVVPPADFGAGNISIIDNSFYVTGVQAYRVYAVKNGIYSSPTTGNVTYTAGTTDVVGLSVVNLNKSFYAQWSTPSTNSRFVTAYNVYKHEHAVAASLAEGSATLVYSGMNTSFMYTVSGADNDNFHKFWITTTIA